MADKKIVTITMDDKKIEAPVNQPLLQTALDNGIAIPYFCYHADLGPDGNCRMCLVEIEKVKKLQISCMTYPSEGMIVHTQSERVKAERKAVLEFILVNHPLDCPICDKVGECMLQANYFTFSGQPSHFSDPYAKVRAPKLTTFSDRILYDSERCIKCARCTRFTSDVSKTYGLGLVDRGVHSTVSFSGNAYQDPYSDCVTDICPVGALTRKDFRFKARVYTLRKTESVCPLCSRGCNTYVEHKHDTLYRVMPRRNPEVNKSWMCNAGRDLHLYLNRPRCSDAVLNGLPIPYNEALLELKKTLDAYQHQPGSKKALAIASAFGSNEETAAFVELFSRTFNAQVYFKTDTNLNAREYPADNILITADKNPNRHTLVHTHGLKEIADAHAGGNLDLLVVWGEGLANSLSASAQESLLAKAKTKILLTAFQEEKMERYNLVIPTRTFVEKSGTFTNCEGKISHFRTAFVPQPHVKEELALFEELRLMFEKAVCCG